MVPIINRIEKLEHKKILLIVIIVALLLRIFLAVGTENFNHSDENYQIYEQAHRLVFGYGMITWEYRYAARSWLVPGLTAGLLYPYKLLGLDDPRIYIPGIKIMLALLSMIIVLSAYQIGKTLYNVQAGLWAAFFCAVWYDVVYFSIRPLSEFWATIFLIGAIALPMYKRTRLTIIISAVLTCLAGAIRINYIPAVFFIFIFNLISLKKNRISYSTGFTATIVIFILFEWLTLGYPNISHYNQFLLNRTFFMEGSLGTSFSIEYFMFLGYGSLFTLWLALIGGLIQWKKHVMLITTVLILILSHILIPAKDYQSDYRHIIVLIPLLLIMAALPISLLKQRIADKFKILSTIGLIIIFTGLSIFGAFGKFPFQSKIYEGKLFKPSDETIFENRDQLKAFKYLSHEKDIVGIYDLSQKWFRSGSYYYLHKNVPIYYFDRTPANMGYISHFITDFDLRENDDFILIKRIGNVRIHKRTDTSFIYMTDPKYTLEILQRGIDDKK